MPQCSSGYAHEIKDSQALEIVSFDPFDVHGEYFSSSDASRANISFVKGCSKEQHGKGCS
jgi:hypothetical protein